MLDFFFFTMHEYKITVTSTFNKMCHAHYLLGAHRVKLRKMVILRCQEEKLQKMKSEWKEHSAGRENFKKGL